MNFGKILIISPHPDDEVLGCGGIIAKYGKKVHVHYVTCHHPLVDPDVYTAEVHKLHEYTKCAYSFNSYVEHTNKLHTVPIVYLIGEFERLLSKVKPDSVFVCFPSYNQDHRVVYDALLTAVRPHDRNWVPKNVFVYEQPETLHTNRIGSEPFKPVLFTEIDIKEKIKLYKFYESQVRGHRSPDALEAIAKLRGSFIGKPYAEAFDCVRLTV